MKGSPFFVMLLVFAAGTMSVSSATNAGGRSAREPAAGTASEKAPQAEGAQKSPVAISNMANMYYKGQGAPQDYARALYLYRKAAQQGHVASMIMVAGMYERGQGTRIDYAAAMQWYQNAATGGYASAQKAIGDFYRLGRGVSRDDALAAQWYSRAAEQNFAEAQCLLGYMTLRGRGVAQNLQKARALFEEAIKQNNACAQHYLAFMYMNGMVTMLPDTKKGLELDRMAAGNGDAEAQYNIGKAHEIGWMEYSTEAEAMTWYRHSAGQGYPLAMERLASVYEKGELRQKADPEKAQMWRERAKTAWTVWPEPRPDQTAEIRFMPLK